MESSDWYEMALKHCVPGGFQDNLEFWGCFWRHGERVTQDGSKFRVWGLRWLGYPRERYPETAFPNRNRTQKLEESKETLIQGIRKESLGRRDTRGASTERRTLLSTQVDVEAVLIEACNLIWNKRLDLGHIRPTFSFCLTHNPKSRMISWGHWREQLRPSFLGR